MLKIATNDSQERVAIRIDNDGCFIDALKKEVGNIYLSGVVIYRISKAMLVRHYIAPISDG